MAQIIPMPQPRPRSRTVDDDRSAEILFFTGVRYMRDERGDTDSAETLLDLDDRLEDALDVVLAAL